MTPILGIMASSVLGAVTATSFESIATTTVGSGGSSSVTFSSIPGTYTHLQIRYLGRGTRALTIDNVGLEINADSGNNYAAHNLQGDGSSASASALTSNPYTYVPQVSAANATASIFGVAVIDILDYANTNKYKTLRALGGHDQNGSGVVQLRSGLWQSTNAITSIKLTPDGGSWAQYSHFALYGIKS